MVLQSVEKNMFRSFHHHHLKPCSLGLNASLVQGSFDISQSTISTLKILTLTGDLTVQYHQLVVAVGYYFDAVSKHFIDILNLIVFF